MLCLDATLDWENIWRVAYTIEEILSLEMLEWLYLILKQGKAYSSLIGVQLA
jgi:hypothetical protein